MKSRTLTILVADDAADDRFLAQEAVIGTPFENSLHFVENGEELMDYLRQTGRFAPPVVVSRPDIILLDLNMPRKDGREALSEIKADPNLRSIPVVVMTTSKAEEDVLQSYDLGVSSFVVKPVTFSGLEDVMQTLGKYWVQIAELPEPRG